MKIGIDLGGTNVRVGLVENGAIAKKLIESCKAHQSEIVVVDHIKKMISELINSGVTGIGIGVPSVVDANRGVVYNVANIPSWKEVRLKEIMEHEFGIPVAVNNDCNCFAMGEYFFGEGSVYKDLVCVAMGTGVGSGIIIDGKLYNGSNTGAGEIGSMPYLQHDYEYYCGSNFFIKEHSTTGKKLYEKACTGDKAALKLWREVGFHIGNLMKAVLYTYDPQAVILGGSISHAFEFFSESMYESMKSFPYPETLAKIKIHTSKKEDIALLGASAL